MADGLSTAAARVAVSRVMSPESIERRLLDAAVLAVAERDCAGLDRVPVRGRNPHIVSLLRPEVVDREALAEAIRPEDAGAVDAEAVASWICGRYTGDDFPAVLFGSPHGGVVHLAAALGAPWLPTGFVLSVAWPAGAGRDWRAAREAGREVARRLLASNPSVTVRQVHDPVLRGRLCATTLTFHVRWRRVPAAYREFLDQRVRAGGPAVVFRDARTWPVSTVADGHSFQVGSPTTGWQPGDYRAEHAAFRHVLHHAGCLDWADPDAELPRHYAELAGEPAFEQHLRETPGRRVHRVIYPRPETLSGYVADLHREWFGGDRGAACVVECDGLLDPWLALRHGIVPYWCESASRRAVAGAEWWLAGSRRFDRLRVLPAPPGSTCPAFAAAAQWRALTWFARREGLVDNAALRRYPQLPLPTSHATQALRRLAKPRREVPRPRLADVLATLGQGMLVL
ncbi:hypothetical protein O7635_22180 [Asanoa sp. WMMD1127]|uniref:hypothetical protein n=1 Tax=Asanoa sp. WMMD1127 TaxID=3016107 RepID=UPI002417977D|nr:hypothetical protein [Asanoa sp. WMMD1127]MDG4824566.1 hypothetical protein [Asanoa sp. WMMD1127]